MIQTITAKLMNELPAVPPTRRMIRIHDDKDRGFHVEVRHTSASYKFRYFNARGKERTITIGRHGDVSPQQARKRAQELRATVALGGDPTDERQRLRGIPTVSEFVETRLMPHVRATLRGAVTYGSFARRFVAALGRLHLDEVRPADIEAFRSSLIHEGLANASVNRHLAFARMAFNRARKWGLISGSNPAASPGMLPEQHRDLYLSVDQVRALRKALSQDHDQTAAAAIELLLLTGARRGEALGARWSRIDFEHSQLLVPRAKSGRPHRIPLSPAAVDLLRHQRARVGRGAKDGFVFPGRRPGKPMFDLRGAWTRVKQAAGLPAELRLHDLRHTFASTLVNQAVPIERIGAILGHRSPSTTARYTHHAPERLIQTAAIAAEAWGERPTMKATFIDGVSHA